MATNDKCCSIAPYFKVNKGKLVPFKRLCKEFLAQTQKEEKVLYYGFCFDGDEVHCREGYVDGDGVLVHLDNVGYIFEKALEIAELTRIEIHGPRTELGKIRGPLKDLSPQYFVLEYGFRR